METAKEPDYTMARIVTGESDATKQLVDPGAVKKVSRMDLVELAKEVQKADNYTRCTVSNKLQVIAEQIRFLQEQARTVLEDARDVHQLHYAQCNFKKIPGKTYYLYKRQSGALYFSMISPQEWGSSCPHEFLGGHRLEYDMSWTKEEDVEQKNSELSAIDRILQAGVPSIENLASVPSHHHANKHRSKPIIEEQE